MPKPIAAWSLPLATCGLGGLLRLGAWPMPRPWRPGFRVAPMPPLVFVLVATLCGLHLLIVRASLHPPPTLGGSVWVLTGASFVALGQMLPRVGRNPFVGMRTKWAPASDANRRPRAARRRARLTVHGVAIAALGAPRATRAPPSWPWCSQASGPSCGPLRSRGAPWDR